VVNGQAHIPRQIKGGYGRGIPFSSGLPAETDSTTLPDFFFTQVMPQIQDIAELKVTLCIFYLLNHKSGRPHVPRQVKRGGRVGIPSPPFITYGELLSLSPLMAGMSEETLRRALSLAVGHGTILRATLDIDGKPEEVYFINTESDKEAIDNIEGGELPISKVKSQENIFSLYEQNIGIITPMIAEELKEAEKLYSEQWIKQAFKEAVVANKRSWRYIARILERWASEGKEGGEHRQSTKEGDADKYIRGKYGHLVKR